MTSTVLTILAGGFSRRYQDSKVQWQDKALTNFENVPLLVNLVNRARRFYDDICISVNSEARKEEYLKILHQFEPSFKPNFVVDKDNNEIQGVLQGITSVLTKYQEKEIQFIPTDFPFIDFEILRNIKVRSGGVGILYYSSGMIEPLLTLYGYPRYFPDQFQSLFLSRADVMIRLSSHLNLYNIEQILEVNKLSPSVFNNINIQSGSNSVIDIFKESRSIIIPAPKEIKRSDLSNLKFPSESLDYVNFIYEIIERKQFYASFLWSRYYLQNKMISSEDYQNLGNVSLKRESQFWLDNNLPFLALHALQDIIQYLPEEKNVKILKEISSLRKKLGIESRKVN